MVRLIMMVTITRRAAQKQKQTIPILQFLLLHKQKAPGYPEGKTDQSVQERNI